MKAKIMCFLMCTVLMCTMPVQEACGQAWLQEVGRGVKDRAKNKVKQKIEEKIYKKVDKAVGNAMDKALGNENEEEKPTEGTAEKPSESAVDKAMNSAADRLANRLMAATDSLASSLETLAGATGELAGAAQAQALAQTQMSEQEAAAYEARRAEALQKFSARPSGGEAFYPTRKGMVLTYASKGAKGETDAYTRTTITDIRRQDDRNFSVSTTSELLDQDKNPITSEPMTADATVTDGVVGFNPASMAGQLTEGMVISGDFFFLPDNITTGDTLPDYRITINISGLNTSNDNTGISVIGQEEVAVSGRNLDCYVIEWTSSVAAMGFKTSMKQKAWYARGIGMVKQESYSPTGAAVSTYELVELNY